jgi:rod shape-determining protein MreB and related proteins
MRNFDWKEMLYRFWRASLNGELAIDLGTANTRIYLPGEGIVIDQPSMIALNTEKRKVLAVGEEARVIANRQLSTSRLIRPIKNGVIADFEIAGEMLSTLIRRALTPFKSSRPALLICVPADITQMEEIAYKEAASRAGAWKVNLIEQPYAAAVGAGLKLRAAPACMIVDLGAGTTDIAVTSSGRILYVSTRRAGGNDMDRAIAHYLHHERTLDVSEETAEKVKIGVGTVGDRHLRRPLAVRGRDVVTGLPKEITVTSEEVRPLIQPALRGIKQHVRAVLEEIPIEASVDLLDSGISLSGGLSELPGLADHLSQELGLYVRVVPDPMLVAVMGAGQLLDEKSDNSILKAIKGRESTSADESGSSLAGIRNQT